MILLDIALFATADANWQLALDAYVDAANYHLANFDMRLHVFPAQHGPPVGIPLEGPVWDPPPDGDYLLRRPGDLRFAASVVMPTPHGMPVIFTKCNKDWAGRAIFQEEKDANRGVHWLNYVLIRENNLNSDRGCLLHELIHAANYSGDLPHDYFGERIMHDADPSSIMRPDPLPGIPEFMQERHAQALRTSYFARSA